MLVKLLENLIVKKFYENKEEIQNKLNVFYAMNKISDEEFSNLTLKVEEVYFVPKDVEDTELENDETTQNIEESVI